MMKSACCDRFFQLFGKFACCLVVLVGASGHSVLAADYCYDANHSVDGGNYFGNFFTDYDRKTLYDRLDTSDGQCRNHRSGGGRTDDSPCRGLPTIEFDNLEICRADDILRSSYSTYRNRWSGATYPYNQDFPSFNVHYAYVTNSGSSCSDDKRWNINMRLDDCKGYPGTDGDKANECPSTDTVKYHTGAGYFEYLCQYACDLYHDLSGMECSEIVDQKGTTIGVYKENWNSDLDSNLYAGNPVVFALGDPARRKLLEAAIERLNEYLFMARITVGQLGRVSSLNLGELKAQLNELDGYIRTAQSEAHSEVTNLACAINQYENWERNACNGDTNAYKTCDNEGYCKLETRNPAYYERDSSGKEGLTGGCAAGLITSDCCRCTQYKVRCDCDDDGICSTCTRYDCDCNTSACQHDLSSWCSRANNELPTAYREYHRAYEWATETDQSTYESSNCSSKKDVDHRCYVSRSRSLPYLVREYIQPQKALVMKKIDEYEATVADSAFANQWRGNLCPYNSVTLGCVSVNLLQGCLRQANEVMETESKEHASTVSHMSRGYLSVYSDYHRCTGDSDMVSTSRCSKWACYVEREYCMNINPFYVEPGKACSFGTKVRRGVEVYGKKGRRTCDICGDFNNCREANVLGFRYDTQHPTEDSNHDGRINDLDRTVNSYYIDMKNSSRYLTILGECKDGDSCVTIHNNAGTPFSCSIGGNQCVELGVWPVTSDVCFKQGKEQLRRIYIDKTKAEGASDREFECAYSCIDACRAHGLYSLVDTGCTSEDSCINTGDTNCLPEAKLRNHRHDITLANPATGESEPITCYDARCQKAPLPPAIDDDICFKHGFLPLGWSCGSNEVKINPDTKITYYENGVPKDVYCTTGCKRIDLNETCEKQGISVDNRFAGNQWVNNVEKQYTILERWEITIGERRLMYRDSLGHDHEKISAPNGTHVTESLRDNTVCRYDGCHPNDAKIVAKQLQEQFESTSCDRRYNVIELGSEYDGCDHIYTFQRCVPKTSSCTPTCRRDDDLGFGLYKGSCEKRGSTSAVNTDSCNSDGTSSGTYASRIACQAPKCMVSGSEDKTYTLSIEDIDDEGNIISGTTHGRRICGEKVNVDCHHKVAYHGRDGRLTTTDEGCFGKGGIYECSIIQATPDQSSSECTENNRAKSSECFKVLSCKEELGDDGKIVSLSKHPEEFGAKLCSAGADKKCNVETDKLIFIPAGRSDTYAARVYGYSAKNAHYKAGPNGLRCGKYLSVSSPTWAVSNTSTNIFTKNDSGLGKWAKDNRCAKEAAGLTLTADNFSFSDVKITYETFENLIQINNLPECNSISALTKDQDGFYICKVKASSTNNSQQLQDFGLLDANVNAIIFIDDERNFTINTNIITDVGYFKAIIARGKVIVDKGVGKLPSEALKDHHGCSSDITADLQGFFGARKFEFQHGKVVADSMLTPFNTTLYCDRQLAIAGNIVQWGDDEKLELSRTFSGCVGGDEDMQAWEIMMADPTMYPDYNAYLSPHLFYQRADFNLHAPAWMKSSKTERIEVD